MTLAARKRFSKWLTLLITGFFLIPGVHADVTPGPQRTANYLIHVWRSEDGLPQNSVNCLAQTRDGYLWIGTRSGGLARFDGRRFVTFNPQSTPELKDVEFETLSVDSRGTLWITAGNESIACVVDGKFHLVRERNAPPRWHPLQVIGEDAEAVFFEAYSPAIFRVPQNGPANAMQRIDLNPPQLGLPPGQFCQTHDGAFWYITDGHEIAQLKISAQGAPLFRTFNIGTPVDALAKDDAGEIWVAGGNRIGVMTNGQFLDRTPTNGVAPGGIRQIIPGRNGGLWTWDGDHLKKMSERRWLFTVESFQPTQNHPPLRFFADSQGGLWVIEYGTGIWHVRADGVSTLISPENGLPSKFITSWLEDTEGNIWLGTKEAGLARIRRGWFREYDARQGIPGDVAQSVCEDAQGTIWVGTTTGGLARRDGERFVPVPLPSNPNAPIEGVTVFPDATNGIWVGTVKGGVFRYADGKISRPLPAGPLRDRMAVVNVLMEESSGSVWFGNGSGAYCFQNGRLDAFDQTRGFVEEQGVRALAQGPAGTVWFGTEPGDVWELKDGALTRHHPPAEWANARVSALLPDSDGGLWVGTLGGGLLRFANGGFTRITTKQGLPDNSITQLLSDEEGNLWGGTYAGIFRASKNALKLLAADAVDEIPFSVLGRFDGLPAQAYSGWFQPACWRSHDGTLWFTTVNGLVSIDPKAFVVNRRPPPVIIEEMRVDSEPRDIRSAASHGIRIEPGRHYVEFRWTGINFSAPDKVRFKWLLEGAEKQWQESVTERSRGYGPLLPGNYRFRVFAANSDGIWNNEGATVAFTVLPFFWETWWFKTGMLLLVAAALVLGVTWTLRRRHRLELERIERRHEMERERARIAQDLHDDLGTSLTQIGLLSSLLNRENTPFAEVRSLALEIRSTSRAMVTALNEIVWAVNPKNDSLNELVGYLGNFAEAFFRSGPIRCRLDIPTDLPDHPIPAEVRHALFLAFKEAINNAAKHSKATEIHVRIHCENNVIHIAIEDNGIGFDPDACREGNGLANMKNRLRKIGGKCEIRGTPDAGTTVSFWLRLF